jgi:septum formation protein
MLARLSGRRHRVYTAVAMAYDGRLEQRLSATTVRFRSLTEAEIRHYVASGEPLDKAGAYGIQGLASRFVLAVDGSYSNVVGLPIGAVRALLDAEGVATGDASFAGERTGPGPFDRTDG